MMYVKGLLAFVVGFAIYQTFRFIFTTSYHVYYGRALNEFKAGALSCELDRRLVEQLRIEIKEKDKLLKYRERVINRLRKTVKKLNETIEIGLQNVTISLANSSRQTSDEKDATMKLEKVSSISPSKSSSPTPFPPNIADKAAKSNRPCCIALKRMTDILRQYMEVTHQLKQQVSMYEHINVTEKMIKYVERNQHKVTTDQCMKHFRKQNVDKEKDFLYLSTDMKNVYEAIPVYTSPKQKVGTYGAKHRNMDLKAAMQWGLIQLRLHTKLPINSFGVTDGLFKTDALEGTRYLFKFKSNSGKLYKLSIIRPFGPYILDGKITEQTLKATELINVIVPLSGRTDRLDTFLTHFEKVCVKTNENVFLTVVIHGEGSSKEIKKKIQEFSKRTGFKMYDIVHRTEPFSRGRALHDGVIRWNGYKNVLLFFCDIDVTFNVAFLRRCRLNTEIGRNVYYPVLFSLYNPKIVYRKKKIRSELEMLQIDQETGTWRPLGYGMMCVYRPDYLKIGGFNLKIKGWGGEDNDLYNRYIWMYLLATLNPIYINVVDSCRIFFENRV